MRVGNWLLDDMRELSLFSALDPLMQAYLLLWSIDLWPLWHDEVHLILGLHLLDHCRLVCLVLFQNFYFWVLTDLLVRCILAWKARDSLWEGPWTEVNLFINVFYQLLWRGLLTVGEDGWWDFAWDDNVFRMNDLWVGWNSGLFAGKAKGVIEVGNVLSIWNRSKVTFLLLRLGHGQVDFL